MIRKETVCEETCFIIREYYKLNTEPLFSVLTDDCIWLGVGNLTVSGAEAIKAQFKDGFLMPPFEMEDTEFRRIETGSDEQLMVLGEYTLYSSEESEVICTVRQRLTFCYRKEREEYRLYHMHVSNEYSELVGDEVFPVQISRQTYLHVQKLLKESAKRSHPKLEVKANGFTRYVDTNMIRYIQAIERECVLCLMNENRAVQMPAKELEKKLPSNFYRLHRSYIVNCNYIEKIERYKLTLVTGEELPIPKMRYTQIRDEIREKIQKKEA